MNLLKKTMTNTINKTTNMKTMGTIKNKQSKLFYGISEEEITKVIDKYESFCLSRIQSMDDELRELLSDVVMWNTDLDRDEINDSEEFNQLLDDYNWESRYTLMRNNISICDMIENINQ